MESNEPPTPPTTVRALGFVLIVQAISYMLTALVGGVAYLVRGPDTLDVGGYASFRTQPVTLLVVGLAVASVLVLAARRLPRRPEGLYRALMIGEAVLFVDGIVGFLAGILTIWWLIGVLVTFAALWYLRADETRYFLV
jgi:hypothetical protein